MDVALDPGEVHAEDVHLVGLQVLLGAVALAVGHDVLHVLVVVEVGHVPGVEDIVDVLQHLLVDDLRVHEEEAEGLVLHPRGQQDVLYVLPPVLHRVVLYHLDLPQTVPHYVSRQLAQRLSAATPHSQQQGIPLGLPQDPRYLADMLAGVQEHHQLHGLLVAHLDVELLEVLLNLFHVLLQILHLDIGTALALPPLHEISEDNPGPFEGVTLVPGSGLSALSGFLLLLGLLLFLTLLLQGLEGVCQADAFLRKHVPVLLAHQAILVHSHVLMVPEVDEAFDAEDILGVGRTDALDHLPDIPKVEGVVGL